MNSPIDCQERQPSFPNSHSSERRRGTITNNLYVYKFAKNDPNYAILEGWYYKWDSKSQTGSNEKRFNVEPQKPGDLVYVTNVSGRFTYCKAKYVGGSVEIDVHKPREVLSVLEMRKHNYTVVLYEEDERRFFRILVFKDQKEENISQRRDRIKVVWTNGRGV